MEKILDQTSVVYLLLLVIVVHSAGGLAVVGYSLCVIIYGEAEECGCGLYGAHRPSSSFNLGKGLRLPPPLKVGLKDISSACFGDRMSPKLREFTRGNQNSGITTIGPTFRPSLNEYFRGERTRTMSAKIVFPSLPNICQVECHRSIFFFVKKA